MLRAEHYDPYGAPTSVGVTDRPTLGYRGELHLNTTLHLRNRDHTPTLRRFTARDPLDGIAGTTTETNPYHYTNNNPTNLTDPLGLSPINDPHLNGTPWGDDRQSPGLAPSQVATCSGAAPPARMDSGVSRSGIESSQHSPTRFREQASSCPGGSGARSGVRSAHAATAAGSPPQTGFATRQTSRPGSQPERRRSSWEARSTYQAGTASVECATSHHRCGEAGVWITAEMAHRRDRFRAGKTGRGLGADRRAVGSVTPAPRALPAARQVDATWGPAHQYAQVPDR